MTISKGFRTRSGGVAGGIVQRQPRVLEFYEAPPVLLDERQRRHQKAQADLLIERSVRINAEQYEVPEPPPVILEKPEGGS